MPGLLPAEGSAAVLQHGGEERLEGGAGQALPQCRRIEARPILLQTSARLAEPIVGFRLADFYAEYVNRTVEEGLARLKPPSSGD